MRVGSHSAGTAIAGLGITEVGKLFGCSATQFASDAVRRAVADAGLSTADIDGLLTPGGIAGSPPLGTLQSQLNLRNLKLAAEVQAYGCSAIQMVALASRSIAAGEADVVVCGWADAPLRADRPAGPVYREPRRGWNGLLHRTGVHSPTIHYALATRRHMQRYGTIHEQLGGRGVRFRRGTGSRRHARSQHRWRTAFGRSPVGHDPAGGGDRTAARTLRRAPSTSTDRKLLMLRHSSRMRELNDSMQPLRQGSPAGIKCRPISPAGRSAIVLQANSGPLSQRRTAGKAPRSAAWVTSLR
jgi:hypothetical protein